MFLVARQYTIRNIVSISKAAESFSDTILTAGTGTCRHEPVNNASFFKSQKAAFCSSKNGGEGGEDNNKSEQLVTITIEEAQSTTTNALKKLGWDDYDATLQAEIMVSAEICGNNQGLVKMYQPALMAPHQKSGKPTIERDTNTSSVVNANQAPGMLAAVTAVDLAASKILGNGIDSTERPPTGAKQLQEVISSIEGRPTISIVSSYNSSTSSGRLALYCERLAKRGLIGIGIAGSPEFVAAAPGGRPVLGTNPIAIAFPLSGSNDGGSNDIFSFDMSTSAISLYGVLTAKSKGIPLPPNVAYNSSGEWTTDADVALGRNGGSIATFGGGHKGVGLSLCVEILAGALSGAAVLGTAGTSPTKKEAKSWGHTFVAIDPSQLVDDFPLRVESIVRAIRQSSDMGMVRIPGERSIQTAKQRLAEGTLPIPRKVWETIKDTAKHGLK